MVLSDVTGSDAVDTSDDDVRTVEGDQGLLLLMKLSAIALVWSLTAYVVAANVGWLGWLK